MEKKNNDKSWWFMRFAITPLCNFRCVYCNPGSKKESKDTLSEDEILTILEGGIKAGINRVHWTGGEPTLMDLEKLVSEAKAMGYLDQIMTTNGSKGGDYLNNIIEKGINRIIVSLDSVDPERNRSLTGTGYLPKVIETLSTGALLLEDPTKMNVVYMEETKKEIGDMLRLVSDINSNGSNSGQIVLKLIEMSKNNPVFFEERGSKLYDQSHSSRDELLDTLGQFGTLIPSIVKGNNPNTEYYHIPEQETKVGIVAIPSRGYKCGGKNCKKVRLNPYGAAAICIGQEPISLRGMDSEAAGVAIKDLTEYKPVFERLNPGRKHYKAEFGYWRFGACGSDKK